MLNSCACKITRLYGSSVGKKMAMALSGLILVGFVIGHMAGNLKAFGGFDAQGVAKLDHYAVYLRQMGESLMGYGTFLWVVRFVLLGAVILHVVSALQLIALNKASRPQGYQQQKYKSSTVASRTMAIGGILLLFFIVFHILHFTTGQLHMGGFIEGQVYQNVYRAFQDGAIVTIYLIAMGFLCLHLFHGSWSMLQTLGIDCRGWNKTLRTAMAVLAIIVAVGFSSVPLGVYLGILPVPTGVAIQNIHEAAR